MPKPERALGTLKKREWYRDQIVHAETLPARNPQHRDTELHPSIQKYLDRRDIQLYTHQAETVDRARDGESVVITTSTASGKSLAFNLPVFETLLRDPDATALYVYPTKALSNDQLSALEELDTALGTDADPAVYDGDTPRHLRPGIRRESRIILTNPHGLHHYLPWHTQWRTFFESLQYVVMDEVHHYRGIFGSNVAWVVRRLKRMLERYGSDPRFILSSATIANPAEHAHNLAGEEFTVVDHDGSGSGEKIFLLWDPLQNPDHSPHAQTSDLLSHLVDHDLQTLAFTSSRRMAELVADWTRDRTPDRDIRSYRAGYRPGERRLIEQGLRSGEVDGAASTNALELGIDIGGLDAVILSGYPGTVVSTWQQAGRAGRGTGGSLAALVAMENPLDQYLMNHPDALFGAPHEHAIVDLDNTHVATGHLACAAAELPIRRDGDLAKRYGAELESLSDTGILHPTPAGYVYCGEARPAEAVSLTSAGGDTIRVMHDGELLETLDTAQAYREAHPGAVLLHQGDIYLVTDLDLDTGVATAERRELNHYTQAISLTETGILNTQEEKRAGGVSVGFGEVEVTQHYTEYRVKTYDSVIGVEPLDLPPLRFRTEGTWFTVPTEILEAVEEQELDTAGGLHAAEHAAIAMTPYYAMCDRWDLGGVSTPHHPDTGEATVVLHDAHEGGVGISHTVHDLLPELLRTTRNLVADCECRDGCPSCVQSPKCGNNNEPLDPDAAVLILEDVMENLE